MDYGRTDAGTTAIVGEYRSKAAVIIVAPKLAGAERRVILSDLAAEYRAKFAAELADLVRPVR